MVNLQEQISNAISAHGFFKGRLFLAVQQGKHDFDVDAIRRDDVCEFGRWLRSLDGSVPVPKEIRSLHAQFHLCAAEVVARLNANDAARAREMIGLGSDFAQASMRLTRAMMDWERALV